MPSQFEREYRRDMLIVGGVILAAIVSAAALIGGIVWVVVRVLT